MLKQLFLRQQEPVSNELQAVLGSRPHWVIRIGTGIFFLIFLCLFILSWFIHYPDIINTSGTIAINPRSLINPKADTIFYAELTVSKKESEKIKCGQKVNLRFERYPSVEYGYLPGMVQSVSEIPVRKDSMLIKVALPKGLCTSYNKYILFRNNLSAQAQILTDNKRLFDRLSGELSKVWKH